MLRAMNETREKGTRRALRVARALAMTGAGTALLLGCAGANTGAGTSAVTSEGPASGGAASSGGGENPAACPATAPTAGARCSAREASAGHCSYSTGGEQDRRAASCLCNTVNPGELGWACVTSVSGPLAPPELPA